ncbi:MAG TPA: ABC transporter substrate-binding protein [Egibacteraceae bacterium]|jgi:osmoprotectant transport system substrate-binding protein|nr:ABC transporter substrate-binding protein [Egibacteraceae bacterium]
MTNPRVRAVAGLAVALAILASCGGGVSTPPVSMGAFDFGESVVLAELYAQALQARGVATTAISQLAGREGTFPALESGEIDFLPEYNGNALAFITQEEIAPTDPEAITARLRAELEPRGLAVLESSPAENRDELVVTAETAERYGLRTVSDLAPVAERLTVGGPIEFSERHTGLVGLRSVYGIEFGEFVQTDAGGRLTVAALEDGTVDVARLFSTDPLVEENNWVVLVEDRPFTLPNSITPIVRADVLTDDMAEAINAVSSALTTEDLVEFNRRHSIHGDDPEAIARSFLNDRGLV